MGGAWRSPVSAPVWGTGGRRFESGRSDHFPSYWTRGYPAHGVESVKKVPGDIRNGTAELFTDGRTLTLRTASLGAPEQSLR